MATKATRIRAAQPTLIQGRATSRSGVAKPRADFASRTRFVRRLSSETIPGLPAASDAFSDGGGAHLADIIGLARTPITHLSDQTETQADQTETQARAGTQLPDHSSAMTVQMVAGRITAGGVVAELGWQVDQELWLRENTAGYWELSTHRPTAGLALSARVASRGRTQLAEDTRRKIGINNGETILILATNENTLALIPLTQLMIRSER